MTTLLDRINTTDITALLSVIATPESVFEIRIPKHDGRRTAAGWFDTGHIPEAIKTINSYNGKANIYVTINPLNPALHPRAYNRIDSYSDKASTDNDILSRRFILVDTDPERPAGVSSTETEHAAALQTAANIRNALTEKYGFSKDNFIAADSGNGGHTLIHVDLPASIETTKLITDFLKALAYLFNTETVTVDTGVYNGARISKVYGTMAVKGDSTADRPHRLSRILEIPGNLSPAPIEAIRRVIAELPDLPEPVKPVSGGGNIDLDAFIQRHNIEVRQVSDWQGWRKHILRECLFDPSHTGSAAILMQSATGAIVYQCKHNSCQGKAWADVYKLLEPDLYKSAMPIKAKSPGGNGHHKKENQSPEATHLTDMGNGERLARKYQGVIRYCFDVNQWLIWTGKKWEWDTSGLIKTLAKKTARAIYNEAAEAVSDEQAEKLAKHAHTSEGEARLAAMIALAQSEPGIPVKFSELNPDKWLLNCLNGTINLKTGNLQPHSAADMITLQVPAEYNPGAAYPNWCDFLNIVTGGDTALQSYLQKAVGYSLTGNTGAQVIFQIYGLGSNGKSTFCNTIRTLLDGYAARLDAEDLMLTDRHNRGQAKEGLADIQGKRYVVGSELQDGRQLNTSLVKDISGQDSIKARRLYAHEVEFTPECKLWLYGNHKPIIKETTLSIWRRIKLIPFTSTIAESARIDNYLETYLLPELPGILSWAVNGCLLWQKEGLRDTEVVKSATNSYRIEEDILADFLADCCILEAGATIAKKELKELYVKWVEDNKADGITSQKTFKARLLEKGIIDGFTSDKKSRAWRGIRAKTPLDFSDISDKTDNNLSVGGQNNTVLPKLSLVNTSRIESYGKNRSETSETSETPEYPEKPCKNCGCENFILNESCTEFICQDCNYEAT